MPTVQSVELGLFGGGEIPGIRAQMGPNSGVSRDGIQNFPQTMDGDEIRSEKGVDGHTFNGKITVVLKMQGKSGGYFCLYFNQIPERANNPQHFCSPGRRLSTELCTSSVD
jgi:hypothetical protein